METLEERYAHDPFLVKLNKKKLLQPGWAGQVDDTEAEYIARRLNGSAMLRRLWQLSRFTRYQNKVTPRVVKKLVRIWSQMPI